MRSTWFRVVYVMVVTVILPGCQLGEIAVSGISKSQKYWVRMVSTAAPTAVIQMPQVLPTLTPTTAQSPTSTPAITPASPTAPSREALSGRQSVDAQLLAVWDKDWVKTIQLLEAYLGASPRDADIAYARGKLYDAYCNYGIVLVGFKQIDDAVLTWEKAVLLNPSRPEAIQLIDTARPRPTGSPTSSPSVTPTASRTPVVTPSPSPTPTGPDATETPNFASERATATETERMARAETATAVSSLRATSTAEVAATRTAASGATTEARLTLAAAASASRESATERARAAVTVTTQATQTPAYTATTAPSATTAPTPTPAPTDTPAPTATTAPTATSAPTSTITPTQTKAPTNTPAPTSTVVLRAPNLRLPIQDFIIVVGQEQLFAWEQVPGGKSYRFQAWMDGERNVRLDIATEATEIRATPDEVGQWRWRVLAVASDGRLGPAQPGERRFGVAYATVAPSR